MFFFSIKNVQLFCKNLTGECFSFFISPAFSVDTGGHFEYMKCKWSLTVAAGLTQICLMDLSILINWTSPFPILGAPGVLFHFYFI